MCQKIVVNNGEHEIETPKEFVEYFKISPIVEKHYKGIVEDACLCQIDIPKSLRLVDYEFTYDGFDYNVESKS